MVFTPRVLSSSSSVTFSSNWNCAGAIVSNSGCVKVWLPISLPSCIFALDDVGFLVGRFSDHKKCRRRIFLFQNIQNFRRPFRVGPVVKTERDFVGAAPIC